MKPFYIASTDTIIRSESHHYVHPQTGEVYGRSDYSNPAKLAEIGAVRLFEETVPDGFTAEEWEIVEDAEGYVRRPTGVKPIPVEAIQAAQIGIIKAQASMRLRETDWRALRAIERLLKDQLPEEDKAIVVEREAIRADSDVAEAEIMAAKTTREVKAAFNVSIPILTKGE